MREVITTIKYICDWCKEEVEEEALLSEVRFTWDGTQYHIELDPGCHAAIINQKVDDVLMRATRVHKRKAPAKQTARSGTSGKVDVDHMFDMQEQEFICRTMGCRYHGETEQGARMHLTRSGHSGRRE